MIARPSNMNQLRSTLCGGLLLLVFLAANCRHMESSDPSVIRRHTWWNYYVRGTAMLEERKYPDARADFERCLGLRSGAVYGFSEDTWRARTYGLHFLEGYFPNRELGISLYHLGDYTNAISFLERSIKQTPSGRAKYYLNVARRDAMAGMTVASPKIVLNGGSCPGPWCRERRLDVAGSVLGEGYVRSIRVNGEPLFIELAQQDQPFRRTIPLKQGPNVVSVEAEDLVGQVVRQERRVRADWQAPDVMVRSAKLEGTEWVYAGICHDDFALAHMTADGMKLPGVFSTESHAVKTVPFEVRSTAGKSILLQAEDLAGNQIMTVLSPDVRGSHAVLGFDQLVQNTLAGRPDAGGAILPASPDDSRAIQDRLSPSLKVSGLDVVRVYDDEYFLDGTASDGGGLDSIVVNGESLLPAEGRGAVQYRFSRRLPLEPGTNLFELAARDAAGNSKRILLTAIRQAPAYEDPAYRLSLGLLPLTGCGEDGIREDVLCRKSHSLLQYELLKSPIRFRLLERDEGWDSILQEQELSLSDLSDPRAALRIRKLLPAELLLMGSLVSHDSGVTLYARIAETEEGEVLCVEDVYIEDKDQDLSFQVAGLIMKIKQAFPLLEGKIVTLSRDRVTVDVGAQQGARPGSRFIVIKDLEDKGMLEQGTVAMEDDKPVQVVISRSSPDSSLARVIPKEAGRQLIEGDCIYAK